MADANDDLISLEDLIREEANDAQPRPEAGASPVAASGGTSAPQPAGASPQSSALKPVAGDSTADFSATPTLSAEGDIDSILAEEDPKFAESMRELEKQSKEISNAAAAATESVQIDSIDVEAAKIGASAGLENEVESANETRLQRWRRLLKSFAAMLSGWLVSPKQLLQRLLREVLPRLAREAKVGAIAAAHQSVRGMRWLLSWLRSKISTAINGFFDLPIKAKLVVVLAGVMGLSALLILDLTFGGKVSKATGWSLQRSAIQSFAEQADHAYSYTEDEPTEDFTDPLYHPEHVLEIERLVVNLRPLEPGANPMGVFAFYIETSNQESAVELKDRNAEVRDVISRTLEQMTVDALSSPEGKEKLKIVLRKSLNAILTRGQIRRIFIKNIVLKA